MQLSLAKRIRNKLGAAKARLFARVVRHVSLQGRLRLLLKAGLPKLAAAAYRKALYRTGANQPAVALSYAKALLEHGDIETCRAICLNQPFRLLQITGQQNWAEKHGYFTKSLGSPEQIPVGLPPLMGPRGFVPAETPSHISGMPPYVATLHNVTIASHSSIIQTPDGFALNDVAAHPQFGRYVSLEYDKTVALQHNGYVIVKTDYPVTHIEKGIHLAGLASNAYGHWVPEFLMRLKFLENHPEYKKTPIIIDTEMPQSHFEYLAMVSGNPVIKIPTGAAFTCGKLLVAPPPVFYPVELTPGHAVPQPDICAMSPDGMRWIQSRLTASLGPVPTTPKTRKVYLTRRNMLWRRASNDAEICTYLASQGFEVIEIEHLTLTQQIQLFRQADTIVAPNGSSMNNLIFAPTTVKMVLFYQADLNNFASYYAPMAALGYNIITITNDVKLKYKHANYHIPIPRLAQTLERIG